MLIQPRFVFPWYLSRWAFGVTALLAAAPLAAQTASTPDEALGPILDAQTLAVARLDLTKVDAKALVQELRAILGPALDATDERLQGVEGGLRTTLQTLQEAGIRELFAVVSIKGVYEAWGLAVAKLPSEEDAQRAAQRIRPLLDQTAFQVEAVGPRLWIGPPAAIAQRKSQTPAARPDLLEALQAAPPAAIQIVLAPGGDQRRAVREMLPRLPEVLGGGPAGAVVDGALSLTATVDLPPQLGARAMLKARDAQTASELKTIVVRGLDWMGQQEEVTKQVSWPVLRPLLEPQTQADMLTWDWSTDPKSTLLLNVLRSAIVASHESARRAARMNQLKQIGLAMHVYHDAHGRMPPQAIRSKEGKPLLSWRVALLPYLENKALYDQFRLDEPWDSEHNRRLLDRMPAVYADPLVQTVRKEAGLTPFVVPLTRRPPEVHLPSPPGRSRDQARPPKELLAIFDPPDGTPLAWIIDGTSNTILVLKVAPQAAVPWTKPDDWIYDPEKPLQGLFPEDPQPQQQRIALAAFADGSVRVLSAAIQPDVFRRLILMNDGQLVGEY